MASQDFARSYGAGSMLLGVLSGIKQARKEQEDRDLKKELLKMEQQKIKLQEKEVELRGRTKDSDRPISVGGMGVFTKERGFQKAPWDKPGSAAGRFRTVGAGGAVYDVEQGEEVYTRPAATPAAPKELRLTDALLTRHPEMSWDEAFAQVTGKDRTSFVQWYLSKSPAAQDYALMPELFPGGIKGLQKTAEEIWDTTHTGGTSVDDFFSNLDFGEELNQMLGEGEEEDMGEEY